MKRALLLACCSCSPLFGLEAPTLAPVDALPTQNDAALDPCTRDDFEDGVIDQALWLVESNHSVVVNEQGGALTISLVPIDAAFGQVSTRVRFDLETATLEIDVVGTPSEVDGGQMTFSAVFDGDTALAMSTGSAMLSTIVFTTMAAVQATHPWEPDEHRFWRIGYDKIAAAAVFSTSRDGVSWTILDQPAFDAPAVPATAALTAFATSPMANPGTARFGSFAVRTAACP